MRYETMLCIGLAVRVWNTLPGDSLAPDYCEDTYLGFAYDPDYNVESITHYDEDNDRLVGSDAIPSLEGYEFQDDICHFERDGYLTEHSVIGVLFLIPDYWHDYHNPNCHICYETRSLFIKVDTRNKADWETDLQYAEIGQECKLALFKNKWHLLISEDDVNYD